MSKWSYNELNDWILNGCNELEGINVISLDINNLGLKKLPNEIFKLINLQYLFCSHNLLRFISSKISRLTNLKTFVCSYNTIITLPSDICELKNLELLDVSNNVLKQFPVNIHELTNLIELNCNWNEMAYLPANLEKLQNLRILKCDNNHLVDVPLLPENNLEVFTYKNNYLFKNMLDDKHEIQEEKIDGSVNVSSRKNNIRLPKLHEDAKPTIFKKK